MEKTGGEGKGGKKKGTKRREGDKRKGEGRENDGRRKGRRKTIEHMTLDRIPPLLFSGAKRRHPCRLIPTHKGHETSYLGRKTTHQEQQHTLQYPTPTSDHTYKEHQRQQHLVFVAVDGQGGPTLVAQGARESVTSLFGLDKDQHPAGVVVILRTDRVAECFRRKRIRTSSIRYCYLCCPAKCCSHCCCSAR